MRKKDISKMITEIEEKFGFILPTKELDSADLNGETVYIAGGEVIAMEIEGEIFLTLKGLLKYKPETKHVIVDDGAVSFLYNGADVMSPGVIAADPEIAPGDLVWVKEEKYGRPLVVGRALISGTEMVESAKGKAVKTIHYLSDHIWNVDV